MPSPMAAKARVIGAAQMAAPAIPCSTARRVGLYSCIIMPSVGWTSSDGTDCVDRIPSSPAGAPSNIAGAVPSPTAPQMPSQTQGMPSTPDNMNFGQEYEIRSGNPNLSRLDKVAGLVPGIPKPEVHYTPSGMVITRYPSGRVTAQNMSNVPGMKTVAQETPDERKQREIDTRVQSAQGVAGAKEASKIRDQATALANSANLVQQGYNLLDENPDLTGIGSGIASKFNLSNNPNLGKFTTVAGKLQAELGKYASQRGGIQAVNWASSVKPSQWKPEDYNYGMFEGIQQNLQDDYNTLNQQYKAATGKDLPIKLPKMARKEKGAPGSTSKEEGASSKVTKWKLEDGKLVKE